jgi:uncharacterized protein DUF3105
MSLPPARRERVRHALGRLPVPALLILGALLAPAPVGLALSHDTPEAPRARDTLADVARKAGCRLREYDDGRVSTNPPVTGRMVERAVTTDGSHIGNKPPSLAATTHALLHGRVLIQYRPGLPRPEVLRLDGLVNEDPDGVVGFANQTGMTSPVAATAYLNLLTCPGVTARTLHALRVFRDRRRAFGNAF